MGQGLKPPCSGWLLLAQKGLMLRVWALPCDVWLNEQQQYVQLTTKP